MLEMIITYPVLFIALGIMITTGIFLHLKDRGIF